MAVDTTKEAGLIIDISMEGKRCAKPRDFGHGT